MRPLTDCHVVVLGWDDDQHRRKVRILEVVSRDALTAWNFGLDEAEVADGLAEKYARFIHDLAVDIEKSAVVVRIDPTPRFAKI